MKMKLFAQETSEKTPDQKYYKGLDSLQRAQTILDEMKANMMEFGVELDKAAKQAAA